MDPPVKYIHHSRYFCGNEISKYGLENGYVDYATLAKSFDAVLNNDILSKTADIGYWEPIQGFEEDDNGNYHEVFQWYIISDSGAKLLQEMTNELLYYNEELYMYVWGICHYGTSWSYVLTDIPVLIDND
jgi:hypothetical protein